MIRGLSENITNQPTKRRAVEKEKRKKKCDLEFLHFFFSLSTFTVFYIGCVEFSAGWYIHIRNK